MDSSQLRSLQAPLKEQYLENPDSAKLTLRAGGSLGEDGITCRVDTGRQLAEAGLHPATGGDGTALCSGDMLLESLVACAGVTLRAVATALEIPVRGGRVTAEGDLSISVARWPSTETHRSASSRSVCISNSTPTPMTSNWPRW